VKRSLAEITSKGPGLPSRIVFHAVEKFGKTSFAAQVPGVVFGMSPGETGLLTLIDAGQLPEVAHFPEWTSWGDVFDWINFLTNEEHKYTALAIDTLNGIEKLCHAEVCQREFGGDWGEHGFAGYGRGVDVSLPEIRLFLAALDKLRVVRRMGVLMLCHTQILDFKNPQGPDYYRYIPAVNKKTWELVNRWADVILFGDFYTEAVKEKGQSRAKGKGGQDRYIYTVRHAAYDAGNRYGLPEEINCGDSAAHAWTEFSNAMKASRNQKGGA
jgi:hypothetical protein